MRYILKTILCFVLFSCAKKKTETNFNVVNSNYLDSKTVTDLQKKIIENGNIDSYKELILYYSYNKDKEIELLPYSIIMSEKYKYRNANYEIFYDIIRLYNNGIYDLKSLNLMDVNVKNYALYYLNKGAKEKEIGCISTLIEIYRNGYGIVKNSEKADSLYICAKIINPYFKE